MSRRIPASDDPRPCRHCGHPGTEHTRTTGPNSIGRFFHRGCADGWVRGFGWLSETRGACGCGLYEPKRWWQRQRKASIW